MDKLKPILEQKFWILSALAIILSVTGWFMSKGTLSAEIDKRRGELKTAFDSVKVAGSNPNEKWTQQVNQQNDLLAKELRIAYEQLYERQKSLMFWPEGFSEEAKKGDPTKVTATDAAVYRARYPDHAEEVRSTIEPYDEETATGKVKFPPERMVDVGLNITKWQVQSPVGQEIYEAQEDLWLYQNLFTAISSINRAATGPADATIRDVVEIILRGGDPERIGQSSSSGSSGGGMDPATMGGAPGGQYPGAAGGAAGPKLSGGKVDFNPDDEFGPDSDGSSGGVSDPSMASPASPDAFGAGAGQQTAAPRKRYIKETEQYKTRGFYLKMVIDHRKLPEVIAGLTAAPWPIRITRVHQVDLHPDDLFDAGPSASGGGFAGAPSMPAGSGFGAGAPGGLGGDAAGPPQIGGASLLTAGVSRGGGFGSSDPNSALGSSTPAGAPAGAAYSPEEFGAPMGLGDTPGVDSADPMAAAMADPDLVVVTIDGWIVMYKPPPADPNAPAPAEPAPESPAPPAGNAASTPPADAAAAATADPATATPAAEPGAAPATAETPPAGAPATPGTPPADAPATPAPAAPASDGTPAPAAGEPPPATPPAEPKAAGDS